MINEISVAINLDENQPISLLKDSGEAYKTVVFVCENAVLKERALEGINAYKDEVDFALSMYPEKELHPKEQLKLYEKLIDENKKEQLFIFTHSENVVASVLKDEDALIVKISDKGIENVSKFNKALPEITSGQIQYLAFDIYSEEYHNQLYSRICKLLEKHVLEWERSHHGDVEDLVERYEKTPGEYNNPYGFKRNNRVEKLPTYVRNAIFYPENGNRKYTKVFS